MLLIFSWDLLSIRETQSNTSFILLSDILKEPLMK